MLVRFELAVEKIGHFFKVILDFCVFCCFVLATLKNQYL